MRHPRFPASRGQGEQQSLPLFPYIITLPSFLCLFCLCFRTQSRKMLITLYRKNLPSDPCLSICDEHGTDFAQHSPLCSLFCLFILFFYSFSCRGETPSYNSHLTVGGSCYSYSIYANNATQAFSLPSFS
jgi:hypothetical protein